MLNCLDEYGSRQRLPHGLEGEELEIGLDEEGERDGGADGRAESGVAR